MKFLYDIEQTQRYHKIHKNLVLSTKTVRKDLKVCFLVKKEII